MWLHANTKLAWTQPAELTRHQFRRGHRRTHNSTKTHTGWQTRTPQAPVVKVLPHLCSFVLCAACWRVWATLSSNVALNHLIITRFSVQSDEPVCLFFNWRPACALWQRRGFETLQNTLQHTNSSWPDRVIWFWGKTWFITCLVGFHDSHCRLKPHILVRKTEEKAKFKGCGGKSVTLITSLVPRALFCLFSCREAMGLVEIHHTNKQRVSPCKLSVAQTMWGNHRNLSLLTWHSAQASAITWEVKLNTV